jgi:hypothetical protein
MTTMTKPKNNPCVSVEVRVTVSTSTSSKESTYHVFMQLFSRIRTSCDPVKTQWITLISRISSVVWKYLGMTAAYVHALQHYLLSSRSAAHAINVSTPRIIEWSLWRNFNTAISYIDVNVQQDRAAYIFFSNLLAQGWLSFQLVTSILTCYSLVAVIRENPSCTMVSGIQW